VVAERDDDGVINSLALVDMRHFDKLICYSKYRTKEEQAKDIATSCGLYKKHNGELLSS